MRTVRLLISLLVLVLATSAGSAVPPTLSYQGVLRDAGGGTVPDGPYDLHFGIYDTVSGGVALWTEDRVVTVENGAFSLVLGLVNPINLPFEVQCWLGTQVGAGPELPRVALTSTPYSMRAQTAGLADGAADADLLDGLDSGDLAAAVHGHVSADLVDAPGLAADLLADDSYDVTSTTEMEDILTITIDIPADGTIVVDACGAAGFNPLNAGDHCFFWYQISEEAGGVTEAGHWYACGLANAPASNTWAYNSMAARRVYQKVAGSHTFRLEAMANGGTGVRYIRNPTITASFLPTSYGPVNTVARQAVPPPPTPGDPTASR